MTSRDSLAQFTHLVLHLGSFIALFTFADAAMGRAQRRRLGGYLFGQRDIDFSGFETTLITALLGWFLTPSGRVSPWRLYAYSLTMILLTSVGLATGAFNAVFGLPGTTEAPVFTIYGIVMFVALAAITLPLDYWSLRVTGAVFEGRTVGPVLYPALVLLDIIASSLPFFALAMVYFFAVYLPETRGERLPLFAEGAARISLLAGIFSYFSVIYVSLIQASLYAVGLALRALSLLLSGLGHVAERSQLAEHPVATVGLILGLISYATG